MGRNPSETPADRPTPPTTDTPAVTAREALAAPTIVRRRGEGRDRLRRRWPLILGLATPIVIAIALVGRSLAPITHRAQVTLRPDITVHASNDTLRLAAGRMIWVLNDAQTRSSLPIAVNGAAGTIAAPAQPDPDEPAAVRLTVDGPDPTAAVAVLHQLASNARSIIEQRRTGLSAERDRLIEQMHAIESHLDRPAPEAPEAPEAPDSTDGTSVSRSPDDGDAQPPALRADAALTAPSSTPPSQRILTEQFESAHRDRALIDTNLLEARIARIAAHARASVAAWTRSDSHATAEVRATESRIAELTKLREETDRRIADLGAQLEAGRQSLAGAERATARREAEAARLREQLDARRRVEQAARETRTRQLADLRVQLGELDRQLAADPAWRWPEPTEIPVTVGSDPRPLYTSLGAAAGAAISALIVLPLILTPLRLRRSDDLAQITAEELGQRAVVGSIPARRPDDRDPDLADRSALAVHEVRALLEVRAAAFGRPAFALTSPARGAGVTSLTLGVASSFALSGSRTLLIDCDITARAMRTARTTTPPLGSRQPPDRGISGGKSEQNTGGATGGASPGGQSVDQVMLDLGYLHREEFELLALPEHGSAGLLAALDGRPLDRCVLPTAVPNLDILPVLAATPHDAGRLSAQRLNRILDEARRGYDFVLLDAGPIPGGVEALIVAAAVDGVVLVVERGQYQKRVDRSLSYLRVVNAHVLGTVLNRARADDTTVQTPDGGRRRSRRSRTGSDPADGLRRLPPTARSTGSGLLAAAILPPPDRSSPASHASSSPAPIAPNPTSPDPRPIGPAGTPSSGFTAADIEKALEEDEPLAAERGSAIETPALPTEPAPTIDDAGDLVRELLDRPAGDDTPPVNAGAAPVLTGHDSHHPGDPGDPGDLAAEAVVREIGQRIRREPEPAAPIMKNDRLPLDRTLDEMLGTAGEEPKRKGPS